MPRPGRVPRPFRVLIGPLSWPIIRAWSQPRSRCPHRRCERWGSSSRSTSPGPRTVTAAVRRARCAAPAGKPDIATATAGPGPGPFPPRPKPRTTWGAPAPTSNGVTTSTRWNGDASSPTGRRCGGRPPSNSDPTTRRGYWQLLHGHVLPAFGARAMGGIDHLGCGAVHRRQAGRGTVAEEGPRRGVGHLAGHEVRHPRRRPTRQPRRRASHPRGPPQTATR